MAVDPSPKSHVYVPGVLVTVDVAAEKATEKGAGPLRSVGVVVILATRPLPRTGAVVVARTTVFLPAAEGSSRFWLITPCTSNGL